MSLLVEIITFPCVMLSNDIDKCAAVLRGASLPSHWICVCVFLFFFFVLLRQRIISTSRSVKIFPGMRAQRQSKTVIQLNNTRAIENIFHRSHPVGRSADGSALHISRLVGHRSRRASRHSASLIDGGRWSSTNKSRHRKRPSEIVVRDCLSHAISESEKERRDFFSVFFSQCSRVFSKKKRA